MPFDVDAARKAGYSEQEIVDYLGKQSGFDVEGALKSGYSNAEVLDFLSKNERPKKAAQPTSPASKTEIDPVIPFDMTEYMPPTEPKKSGMAWSDVAEQALQNAPSSLGGVLRDFGHAVMHPIETAENLGSLLNGIESKAVNAISGRKPGEELTGWQKFFGITDEDEKKADAVGNYLAERYGGSENIKRSIAADPAGVAADVAGLLMGGSGLTRSAAGVANLAGKAGAANALTNAARALGGSAVFIDPVARTAQLAGGTAKLAGKLIPDAFKVTPERIYQSALKPSTTLMPEERARILETGLKERIAPTQEGWDKLQGLQKEVGGKIGDIVEGRADLERAGKVAKTIDPEAIAGGTMDYLYRQLGDSPNRGNLLRRAENRLATFLDEYGADSMDTARAQRMKTRAQAEGEKDYGKNISTPEQEANKALAHELRVAIENNVPEVAPLNQRLGGLNALEKVMKPALGRTGNWDIVGLVPQAGTGSLGAYLGFGLGGPFGAALGGLAGTALGNTFRQASTKAKIAFALDSLRKAQKFGTSRPAIAAMMRAMRLLNTPMMRQALRSGAYTGGTMDALQNAR